MRICSKSPDKICQSLIEALEDRRLLAADLTGSFFGAVPPSLKLTGANHVTVQLRNVGTSLAAGTATVALYVSSDTALDSGDTALLPAVMRKVHLKPGGGLNVPMTFVSPSGLPTGRYYLLADITPSAAIGDTNTANNIVATSNTLSIQKAFVDLTDSTTTGITGVVSVVAKHQTPVSVSVTVTNNGDISAKGKLTVNLYAATHTTLNSTDTLLISKTLGTVSIAAGKTEKYVIKVTPNASDPSGTFYLLADVNPDATIAESDTANNITSSVDTFVINNPAIPPGPYLASGLSSSISSVYTGAGQQTQFSITIGRAGPSTAVEVDEFDSSGNDLGEIAPLVDDGDPTQGDAVANDGIFSGVATITSSSVGTQYFAAVLTDPQLSASITSPIVSIVAAPPPAPTLTSGLTDSNSTVVIGSPEETTFHVSVANATSSTVVDVDEFDVNGNSLGELTQLYDNGSAGNGDVTAGDGIFSGINVIGFTAPGTRYFAAVVSDPSLTTSAQSPTIQIAGVAPISTTQLEADDADDANLHSVLANAMAGGASVPAALATVDTALQSDSNVQAGSIIVASGGIQWNSVDGIPYNFSEDKIVSIGEKSKSVGSSNESSNPSTETTDSSTVLGNPASTSTSYTTGQALVLAPYNWYFAPYDESAPIASSLSAANYQVTFHEDTVQYGSGSANDVTIEDFKNLGQYDAVVISSHGDTLPGGGGEEIDTGVKVTPALTSAYLDDLLTGRLVIWDDTYAITPSFITAYSGGMNGTIVYMSACQSANDPTMAQAFLNQGAGAYLGYTNYVNSDFSYLEGMSAFATLLNPDNNTVGNITGINSFAIDPDSPHAQFVEFGPSTATLPQGLPLSNYAFYVQYNWPQNVADLDTRTTFLGNSAGWDLPGGDYINWSGDNVGYGGSETTTVDLYQAWQDGQYTGLTTIGVGCDWYTPHGGSGPASITIGLENIYTGALKQVVQEEVNPGQEDAGTQDTQFIVTAAIGGSTTNPTVKISVSPNM